MAEANVMEVEMVDFQGGDGGGGGRTPLRYFCHKCRVEIDPKMPGLTCPRCNCGFIEEMSNNLQRDRESVATAPPNVTDQILMDLLTSQPTRPRYDDGDDEGDDIEALPRPRGNSISSLSTSHRRLHRGERVLPLHSFIESVLDSLRDDSYRRFGTDFSEPRLRRYGHDFRRNYGGLEDLFTQILTQLTASGPEPASQEQIDELPVEKVKIHHLDDGSMQCSICLENFILDEEVTSLPCNHLHHKLCIIPWLQLHATCPVCRHLLSTDSQEPAAARSSFRVTERSDLSLDPIDVSRIRAPLEIPDGAPINLSIPSPWEMDPPPMTNASDADGYFDAVAARRSNSSSAPIVPDIEMVNLDNNNVAMDTEFGRHYGFQGQNLESFTSLELPLSPAGTLIRLRDIEVTGVESESDL